jgi:uncharacterized membrane protein YcaP (DUF421 family)
LSELVALLLISNAVQNSMNGGDNSLSWRLVLAGVIMVLSFGLALLTYFSRDWNASSRDVPPLISITNAAAPATCARELLSIRELRALVRKQGVQDLHDVEEAVLESDGLRQHHQEERSAGRGCFCARRRKSGERDGDDLLPSPPYRGQG